MNTLTTLEEKEKERGREQKRQEFQNEWHPQVQRRILKNEKECSVEAASVLRCGDPDFRKGKCEEELKEEQLMEWNDENSCIDIHNHIEHTKNKPLISLDANDTSTFSTLSGTSDAFSAD